MKFLSDRELEKMFSVSRQTIWVWRQKKGFPMPINLGGTEKNLTLESQVIEWATKGMAA